MTSAGLLAELRQRGVEVVADGGDLRCRAPRGELTEVDLAALRAHKAALLAELRHIDPAGSDLSALPIAGARQRLGAVLVQSARFGEVWVAVDPCMAPELVAEEQARERPRPVLLAEDIARLRGKPAEAVRAVLEVASAFGGSRVVQ